MNNNANDAKPIDWQRFGELLHLTYNAAAELNQMTGRKFTPDGHFIGSIGEVLSEYMFGLVLATASNQGFDAMSPDGREVEVKMTGATSVGISSCPEHLLVMSRPAGKTSVIYNGPGAPVWETIKHHKGRQKRASLSRLREMDQQVDASQRLPLLNEAPV